MGNNSRGARFLHLFCLFPKQNLPHSYLSCPACCAEWHSSIVAWLQRGTRTSLHSCIVVQLQHSIAASSLHHSTSAPWHICKMVCMVAPWKAVLQKSCTMAWLHHGKTALQPSMHAQGEQLLASPMLILPAPRRQDGAAHLLALPHSHGDITRNVSFLARLMCVQTCCYLHTCFFL